MKAIACKRVVFHALIDDADVPMSRGFLVRNHMIEFPDLQRSGIALIIEA